jgi:transcriptional regulator with XRE-family HTH domain
MDLAEKIKHLREVEGELRGFNRTMTQTEVVNAMQAELGESISQAYLSQLEKAKRLHLTASSRTLLAQFFKVHPGYLVSDPPDYTTDLLTDIVEDEAECLETWLQASAEEWNREPALQSLLQTLVEREDPRRYIELCNQLVALPLNELEAIVEAITAHSDPISTD